jgi:23S rRNA pseudouridine955/2504/2580 synthase/23S rRNA pseudouridine1911/1915/1917 synthase
MTKIDILLEEDDFVVVNKPSGLLTIPDRYNPSLPSLLEWMKGRYDDIFTVHRLDRDTSGALLFARNENSHRYFSGLFESRDVQNFYYALVNGRLPEKEGTIETALAEHPARKGKMIVSKSGKTAVTCYEVMEDFSLYAWLKVQILTGRTHQIRVHMQSIGHPLVMDELYGTAKPLFLSDLKRKYHMGKYQEEERPLLNRLALHAAILSFPLPTGEAFTIEAPLPRDLHAALQQLRKHG